jgi:hypothetical protein
LTWRRAASGYEHSWTGGSGLKHGKEEKHVSRTLAIEKVDFKLTVLQAFAQLGVGGGIVDGLISRRIVLSNRVDEVTQGFFYAVEASIELLVHGCGSSKTQDFWRKSQVPVDAVR